MCVGSGVGGGVEPGGGVPPPSIAGIQDISGGGFVRDARRATSRADLAPFAGRAAEYLLYDAPGVAAVRARVRLAMTLLAEHRELRHFSDDFVKDGGGDGRLG